jgi:preprotein translocase subunit Sss1
MKTGRNDLCPCGSGKKYKKCCLNKEEQTETASVSLESFDDTDIEELSEFEMIANMYHNFHTLMLNKKPHIKEYKKIRRMHSEIVDSMIDYYENDKFEQKVDHTYQPDAPPMRKNRKATETLYLHELEFDMESDRSVQAFYDMQVYKASPNMSCITEDYINSKRYRKPEKLEFLQSMLDSKLGLFDIVGKDADEGYAYIKDVLSGSEYTLTDVGLSGDVGNDDLLIYTRIITYRGVSFGTGLSLTFSKNDSFIKSFIKRHKSKYDSYGEYGRFAELYKYFYQTPNKTKIIANRF